MAKTLNEAKIAGRTDRKRLPVGGPYWRGIDPDVHLGYRKGKRGGVWLVRWRHGEGYRQRKLGTADDELREGTFDYDAAVRTARDVVTADRQHERAKAEGPILTVRIAVETYAVARDERDSSRKGRQTRSDARSRLERHLIGKPARGNRKKVAAAPLADVPLHELIEGDLIEWRASLPKALKRTTIQRLVNDLKAALNEVYGANRSRLPSSFPETIKHGLRVGNDGGDADTVAREGQVLSDDEVRRLIRAAREIDEEQGWEGDLFRMVVVLAATGARFSQVSRMRVGDVQVTAGRLMIPRSRKGKGSKSGSTPVPVDADVLEALMPVVTGRAKDAVLLERWRNKQVPGSIRWERVGRGPWETSSELKRPWAVIRKRAKMADKVVAYSLRHSSVVRGIRSNLPIRLVAALHDTSVAMIERHYGRYVADGLDELAARAVVPLIGPELGVNVM